MLLVGDSDTDAGSLLVIVLRGEDLYLPAVGAETDLIAPVHCARFEDLQRCFLHVLGHCSHVGHYFGRLLGLDLGNGTPLPTHHPHPHPVLGGWVQSVDNSHAVPVLDLLENLLPLHLEPHPILDLIGIILVGQVQELEHYLVVGRFEGKRPICVRILGTLEQKL